MNAVGSLRIYCSFTQSMDVDKDSGRNIDFKLRWIRKHGHLKETQVPKSRTLNILSKNAQFYFIPR